MGPRIVTWEPKFEWVTKESLLSCANKKFWANGYRIATKNNKKSYRCLAERVPPACSCRIILTSSGIANDVKFFVLKWCGCQGLKTKIKLKNCRFSNIIVGKWTVTLVFVIFTFLWILYSFTKSSTYLGKYVFSTCIFFSLRFPSWPFSFLIST